MNGPTLELSSLRVFSEVAATRSMTLAAARLGLTQSAVSQAIQRMGRALGVTLVEPGKRPVVLTAAGRLLVPRAEKLLRDAARLPHDLKDAARLPTHEIRLGLVDSFASTAGPGLILALSNEATRVVVWSGLAPSLGAALMGREVDMIVTPDPIDDLDELVRWPVWREPFVLLLPRSDSLGRVAPTLESLAATRPMVRFSARSHTGVQIERHLRRTGVSTERRIEVDGADALVAMVAAGLGWAVATPLCLLQGIGHAPHVRALPLPAPQISRTLSLLCRANGPLPFAERAAKASAAVLHRDCLRPLRRLSAELASLITIPDHDGPTAMK